MFKPSHEELIKALDDALAILREQRQLIKRLIKENDILRENITATLMQNKDFITVNDITTYETFINIMKKGGIKPNGMDRATDEEGG